MFTMRQKITQSLPAMQGKARQGKAQWCHMLTSSGDAVYLSHSATLPGRVSNALYGTPSWPTLVRQSKLREAFLMPRKRPSPQLPQGINKPIGPSSRGTCYFEMEGQCATQEDCIGTPAGSLDIMSANRNNITYLHYVAVCPGEHSRTRPWWWWWTVQHALHI